LFAKLKIIAGIT